MRPGRLDRILYVSPPDLAGRKEIFKVNFAKMAVHEEVNIDELAVMVSVLFLSKPICETMLMLSNPFQTAGCSGAEIVSICQDAALNAMNENIDTPNVSVLSSLVSGGLNSGTKLVSPPIRLDGHTSSRPPRMSGDELHPK